MVKKLPVEMFHTKRCEFELTVERAIAGVLWFFFRTCVRTETVALIKCATYR